MLTWEHTATNYILRIVRIFLQKILYLCQKFHVPYQNYSSPAANSRLSPLPPEPYDCGATIDIPLDSTKDLRKKEKELQAKEAELKRREQVWRCVFYGTSLQSRQPGSEGKLHIAFCVFAAVAPPILFRGKSLAGILPAIDVLGNSALVGIFYFIGFAFFCIESMISIWVIQQVYMYF